jgi:hypothetical protein
VWHELVFRVKWSPDPSVGFVELWHNRERAVAKRNVATMYAGMRNYLKLGLYRSSAITPVGVVYHDGFIQATQLVDVLPPPTSPTPDAGTPDAGTPDAGTSPGTDAGSTGAGDEPSPPVGVPVDIPGAEPSAPLGCSVAGSPLLAIGLLSLLGGLRLRRWR